jgi:hypothetical protein
VPVTVVSMDQGDVVSIGCGSSAVMGGSGCKIEFLVAVKVVAA